MKLSPIQIIYMVIAEAAFLGCAYALYHQSYLMAGIAGLVSAVFTYAWVLNKRKAAKQ